MANKNVKGILTLAVVVALSFGVVFGSRALTNEALNQPIAAGGAEQEALTDIDVAGFTTENAEIRSAGKTASGDYLVTVAAKGYHGDVVLQVGVNAAGDALTGVSVVEQSETEGLGANIETPEFLNQFAGMKLPVYLPGMNTPAKAETPEVPKDAVLTDGTYEAKGTPDSNGMTEVLKMTVADGKITEVSWDAVGEDGSSKALMSESGEYVMTEDGPTWAAQAQSLAEALIANQSLDFLTMDDQGKTDAVAGVSISVGGFADLAADCLAQAAGLKTERVLADGTYEAKGEPDSNGMTEVLKMTVADGKITEVSWDAVGADGSSKALMSESGEYVMTEDGPTWAAQSQSLAEALIANQSLDFLTMDDQGKTDAVAGVSISVGSFASLAENCLAQAAGEEIPEASEAAGEGTQMDAVSGATISSKAVAFAINGAYEFVTSVVLAQ